MIHYLHCQLGFDLNKGGTVGYLSSLLDGMEKLGRFESLSGIPLAFIFQDIVNCGYKPDQLLDMLKSNSPFPEAYNYPAEFQDNYVNKYQAPFYSTLPSSELIKINLAKIGSIHIHGGYNFLPVYNFLRLAGLEDSVVKILTTHNPWKPELEDIAMSSRGSFPDEQKAVAQHFWKIRDNYSFSLADAYLFPSEESMEGYLESWPEFSKLIKKKKVYFMASGTEQPLVTVPRSDMRSKYKIHENAKVFLYLGRFFDVRGSDLLVEAAKTILSERTDVYFIVVGEERKVPIIDHVHWIEEPYTKIPGNYLNMADACLCPNRGSFFDLSMIESLALGIPMIAAHVGGYKYLDGKTKGTIYFERGSAEGLKAAIDDFCSLPEDRIRAMREENIALYQSEFTPQLFAQRYLDTVDKIYEDFDIVHEPRKIARMPIYLEIEKKDCLHGTKPQAVVPPPAKPQAVVPPPAKPQSVVPKNPALDLEIKFQKASGLTKVFSLFFLDRKRLKRIILKKYSTSWTMRFLSKIIPG